MKNFLNKISNQFFYRAMHKSVFASFLLFIGCTFASCFIVKIVLKDSEDSFNYGKVPMYFILAILVFLAILFFILTILNFKKTGISNKRYTPEEKKELIEKNQIKLNKEIKYIIALPLIVMLMLFAGVIISIGIKDNSKGTPNFTMIFIGIGIIVIGLVLYFKVYKKGD